ncbi:MAG: hypothetical protein IT265_05770 [Saprospiraceae bacterium]|nr:hypothetical protein [Saprospiraceae bacterium]
MTKSKSKIIPEKINILQINVIQCHITTGDKYLNNPIKWDKIVIGIKKEDAFNFEEKGCRFRLFFKFTAMKENSELDLEAEIGIEYHYRVENFNDFISEENDIKHIDVELGSTLLAIAFSTSRGIILEKTQNTYFRGIILPVVDPVALLLEK